jgi:protein phosphatase
MNITTTFQYFKTSDIEVRKENDVGGIDFIGDVHGCFDQLLELVTHLGYKNYIHPDNRRLVLLGDVCDRGPKNFEAFRFADEMRSFGHIWIMGNHDNKIFRYLQGNPVTLSHGAQLTADQFVGTIYDGENNHGSNLLSYIPHKAVIETDDTIFHLAHADPLMHNKHQCVYGRLDKDNQRQEWFDYLTPEQFPKSDKDQYLLFGHYWALPVPEMAHVSDKLHWSCLDTSCCTGGNLTAYSYPENKFSSIPGLFL